MPVSPVLSASRLDQARPAFLPHNEPLTAMNAIYSRRAVRDYSPDPVPDTAVQALLYAAVQAPTAMHEEPWAFAVIQNKETLQALSDFAGRLMNAAEDTHVLAGGRPGTDFNIFYNAGTLIAVCGRPLSRFASADCWLAAANIMLAAVGMGLGTCPIGLAVDALNTPQWKQRLRVPEDMTVYAPIIVGVPAQSPAVVRRKPPEILSWLDN